MEDVLIADLADSDRRDGLGRILQGMASSRWGFTRDEELWVGMDLHCTLLLALRRKQGMHVCKTLLLALCRKGGAHDGKTVFMEVPSACSLLPVPGWRSQEGPKSERQPKVVRRSQGPQSAHGRGEGEREGEGHGSQNNGEEGAWGGADHGEDDGRKAAANRRRVLVDSDDED